MSPSLKLKIPGEHLFLYLFLALPFACQEKPLAERLIGNWRMTQVLQHDHDVSAEHNPNNDRWIEFYQDGSFKTGGSPYGDNHGKWKLNNDERVLYLDSSVENDDSEWQLQLTPKSMQWRGIGDPGKEAFTLKFKKEANES